MKRAILAWSNIPELLHLKTTIAVSKKYLEESNKYGELQKVALLDKLESYDYANKQPSIQPVQLVQSIQPGIQSSQLKQLLEGSQEGGNSDIYKCKYMKYKAKYTQLDN